MKVTTASTVLAVTVLSRLSCASPVEAVAIPRVNTTLEMWGIRKVVDLGVGKRSDIFMDKRALACTFQICKDSNCGTSCTPMQYIQTPNVYCFPTGGYHSFKVVGSTCYVSADPSPNCPGRDSGSVPGGNAGPGCYNVNTGRDWQSSFVRGP